MEFSTEQCVCPLPSLYGFVSSDIHASFSFSQRGQRVIFDISCLPKANLGDRTLLLFLFSLMLAVLQPRLCTLPHPPRDCPLCGFAEKY